MKRRLTSKSVKALERIEKNYQLIYTIIMSAPLILAMQILLIRQNTITGYLRFKNISDFTIYDFVLFVVYLLFYTRFFLGDLRYLDLKYLEGQSSDAYLDRYSPFSRFIDFFSLIIHAIFFYVLAASISNFHYFYFVSTAILIFNSAWLLFIYAFTDRDNYDRLEVKSSVGWCINNLITAAILLILSVYGNFNSKTLLFYFAAIFIVNTVIDFSSAWKLYFPRIKDEFIED
jgi:hypothetical protein